MVSETPWLMMGETALPNQVLMWLETAEVLRSELMYGKLDVSLFLMEDGMSLAGRGQSHLVLKLVLKLQCGNHSLKSSSMTLIT